MTAAGGLSSSAASHIHQMSDASAASGASDAPGASHLWSALRALGIPEGRAQDLVEAGLALTIDGHVAVVGETADPISGEGTLLVAGGADGLLADPRTTERLGELVGDRFPGIDTVTLRLEGGRTPEALPGARLLLRYVESTRPPRAVEPGRDGYLVRPYEPAERSNVSALLTEAIDAGYTTLGAAAGSQETAAFVADLLDRIGVDVGVFCARLGDHFAGHATVIWDEDELTGDCRPELFDVFVLPEHRGTSAGRLLTDAAITFAAEAGFPLRGHVVGGGDAALSVFHRLQQDGWRAAEEYWSVPTRSLGHRRVDRA